MKLYSFQSNGHGQKSFFVMSESEEEAKFEGWNSEYYGLTVLEPGQVIIKGND